MGGKQSIIDAAGQGDLNRVRECLRTRGKAALHDRSAGGWTAHEPCCSCKLRAAFPQKNHGSWLKRSHLAVF